MLRFLLLCLVYYPAAHLMGQTLPFGVKAGAHLSTLLRTEPFYFHDIKPGFHAGVFTSLSLGRAITFQPELLYSVQGTKASYNYLYKYSTGETSIHLSYLIMPLAVKVRVYRGFNAQFVLQPGILITAREKGEAVIYSAQSPPPQLAFRLNENVLGSYRTFDTALGGGMGLDTKSRFSFDARALIGLVDVLKPGSQMHTLREDWNRIRPGIKKPMKNYGLQLSLRYAIK